MIIDNVTHIERRVAFVVITEMVFGFRVIVVSIIQSIVHSQVMNASIANLD